MANRYLIETSAWVEYFGGTEKGQKIRDIIENEEIVTSIMAIIELADKSERQQVESKTLIEFIQARCMIVNLSLDIGLVAAKIKNERRKKSPKFGLVDALHMATARHEKAMLVTTDKDFFNMEQVLLVE